jgi:hypothetical protein
MGVREREAEGAEGLRWFFTLDGWGLKQGDGVRQKSSYRERSVVGLRKR